MTKKEFSQALEIAKSDKKIDTNLSIFDGFGLKDFNKVYCTIEDIASLIRYQCFTFNGNIDNKALNEIGHYGKNKFMVI